MCQGVEKGIHDNLSLSLVISYIIRRSEILPTRFIMLVCLFHIFVPRAPSPRKKVQFPARNASEEHTAVLPQPNRYVRLVQQVSSLDSKAWQPAHHALQARSVWDKLSSVTSVEKEPTRRRRARKPAKSALQVTSVTLKVSGFYKTHLVFNKIFY